MKPEISHRCPSCGVTVRATDALFCYECGKPLSSKPKNSESAEAGEVTVSAPAVVDESETAKTAEQAATDLPKNEPTAAVESAVPLDEKKELVADETKADASPATQPAARRGDKTRERLHRASEVARGVTRGVIEEPAKRVEKIRQVSNVVIEEASYDPSLRFVLVALGLFVVCVVLLVLSKVMG